MTKHGPRFTHIRLQVDYGGSPLWGSISGRSLVGKEVAPASLGLSDALVQRLDAWVDDFFAQMNSPDAATRMELGVMPEGSRFLAEGFRIAGDLQEELGDEVTVLYFRNLDAPEFPKSENFGDAEHEWRAR